MRPIRRIAAALTGVLLLQLMLLGSGALCTMRGATRAMAGMTGHGAMHHVAGDTHHGAGPTVSPAPDADGLSGSGTCHGPWASDACASMASCLVVMAAVPASAAVASMISSNVRDVREPAGARAGPTFAPELPPPRV